ncbi:MAG: hypothetical protein PF436_10060, partial [Prolixibacteraceae bacterium]|nr:hypothetical protein [Prolixibacteraceae bacterium]
MVANKKTKPTSNSAKPFNTVAEKFLLPIEKFTTQLILCQQLSLLNKRKVFFLIIFEKIKI